MAGGGVVSVFPSPTVVVLLSATSELGLPAGERRGQESLGSQLARLPLPSFLSSV